MKLPATEVFSPSLQALCVITMKSERLLQVGQKSRCIITTEYYRVRKREVDVNLKKQVLRTFTYGLYAVSCADAGEVNAFTANWLTQVSFDPPLLAV